MVRHQERRAHYGHDLVAARALRVHRAARDAFEVRQWRLQWGQGLNRACIMDLDDSRILGPSRPQPGAWLVELARPQGSVACAPSDRPRVATVPCGFSPAMTARNSVVSECISWPAVPVTSWTSSARPSASRPRYDISTFEPEPEPPEAA